MWGGRQKNSSSLVLDILSSFRKGVRRYLPSAALIEGYQHDQDYGHGQDQKESFDKSSKEFREKIINQIHILIGTKPRIESENGKNYVIYYS